MALSSQRNKQIAALNITSRSILLGTVLFALKLYSVYLLSELVHENQMKVGILHH